MTWKYEDRQSMCDLNAFIWRRKGKMARAVRDLKDGMDEYETIKGYCVRCE